jgi:mono/diheme cytochrome c family protein
LPAPLVENILRYVRAKRATSLRTIMETIHRRRPSLAPIGIRTILTALLLFGVARMVIAAQGNPETAKVKNPVAATPESIAAGKQVYNKSCAPCHGLNGEGGPGNDLIPAAPNLVDDKWDHGSSDGEIFDSIKNGIGPDFNMVPWKDMLKDPDMWNVVNYLRSIAKKKPAAAK